MKIEASLPPSSLDDRGRRRKRYYSSKIIRVISLLYNKD